jgi:hypothetical protein
MVPKEETSLYLGYNPDVKFYSIVLETNPLYNKGFVIFSDF